MPTASRGEIWWADLGAPEGHEQSGLRPVVVLQAEDLNHLSTTIVVPLSSKTHHAGFATVVHLPAADTGMNADSYALCQHLRVLDREKLQRKAGDLSPIRLSDIEAAVAFILGLP